MTWVERLANIVKLLTLSVLEVVALATDAIKVVAEHLDAIVDDLQLKLSTSKPPTPPTP